MIADYLTTLSNILLIGFTLSFFARWNWICDLFTSFVIQYCIGGFVLGAIFLTLGDWFHTFLCLGIGLYSLIQILRAFPASSLVTGAQPNLTVVQYNHLRTNKNTDQLIAWLRKNADKFDIVSLHESTTDVFEKLKSVRDIYPHCFPTERRKDTEIIFLSRHAFTSSDIIITEHALPTMPGLRMTMQTPKGEVIVYGIHTDTPISGRFQAQRNATLEEMAKVIGEDKSPNIVFLGDWNITPFSPHFSDFVSLSKLQNLYSRRWPPVTWPAYLLLPFLKIPIDHVLFSKNMELADLGTGPTMGSDHHALVARFNVH